MTTKVLVTGGAGYLGSVLVGELLVRGFEVTVLDNFMYQQQSLNHLCVYPNLKIVRGEAAFFGKFVDEADVVIPLAAIVGAPACDLNLTIAREVNYKAVATLVGNLRPSQIVIYPNTNSGYGRAGEAACTEDSPLEPISQYGISKVSAEEAVLKHPRGISLRYATLFGASPRMRLDLLVNDFVHRACRDGVINLFEGNFRRNFLHVRDASAAIAFAIFNQSRMSGRAFNCGNPYLNMTKLQLCERIKEQVPDLVINHITNQSDADKRDYVVSNERLLSLGWKPEYFLAEGIRELIRCYQQPFGGWRNA